MGKKRNNGRPKFKCKNEAQKKAIRREYAKKAEKENIDVNLNMKLVKIPNKYLFTSSNPDGTHLYAVYKNDDEVRAIETTHLYNVDEKNKQKVKDGVMLKTKFSGFETPSCVNNKYYNKDIDGKPIDLSKAGVSVTGVEIKESQAKLIKDFAKTVRENE